MQKFEYRTPRFPVDLPVQFISEGSTLSGQCTEISKEGMSLQLPEPPMPGTEGTVWIVFQGQKIEAHARIAHVQDAHAGLVFNFESDRERSSINYLVSCLSAATSSSGPVLIR